MLHSPFKSSYAQAFVSVTYFAAALLACWYISAVSVEPYASIALKAFLFCLTAAFTTSVHQCITVMTGTTAFCPLPNAADKTTESLNIVYSYFMSLNSLGTLSSLRFETHALKFLQLSVA